MSTAAEMFADTSIDEGPPLRVVTTAMNTPMESSAAEAGYALPAINPELLTDDAEGQVAVRIGGITTEIRADYQRLLPTVKKDEMDVLRRRRRGQAVAKILQAFDMLAGDQDEGFMTVYAAAEEQAAGAERSQLIEVIDRQGDHPVMRAINSLFLQSGRESKLGEDTVLMRRAAALLLQNSVNRQ